MSTHPEVNLIHFQNLIAVAFADGTLDEEEEEFLYEMAEDFDIDVEEVKKMIANADQLEFIVPENQDEREEQLVNIVFMSMLDGEIHENEYEMCLHVAEKLELTKKELDEAISLTKNLWDNA